MKTNLILLFILFFSNSLNLKLKEISYNQAYNFKSNDGKLNFYKFSVGNSGIIPNEIKIETEILNKKESSEGTIGAYYDNIDMHNYKELVKSDLGKPIILNNEFIKLSLEKEGQIFLAIFCENCDYKITITPIGENTPKKSFVQVPTIRKLVEENQSDLNITRLEFYSADGFSALMAAFILIFVSIIGCIIMMNIYVHTTALVEQPLKLGRIEA